MRPLPTSPDHFPAPPPEVAAATTPPARSRELDLGPPASNQRRAACPTQRAYPFLLGTSTLLAAAFCGLYLTKPVIVTGPSAPVPAPAATPAPALGAAPGITPMPPAVSADVLPGDEVTKPKPAEPQAVASANSHGEDGAFEETNLRIQHILDAQGPEGENLGRIILDVPVLFQSASLRWTQEDVSQARDLLARIRSYQEKSSQLRDEAVGLLSEWDDLVVHSIPLDSLRGDSPTLPENQGVGTANDSPLNTTESIQIQNR